jgi:CheY-like chemotaxis protein
MTLDGMRRVLVVEDECLIRACLAEGLEDAGYQVDTAPNGAEALARIGERCPDAVLLDLLMPVMDGLEFLYQRYAQPRLAALPVVVLSAAGVPALRDATALRATAVLSKPIDLDVLSAVLEHVLRDSAAGGPVRPAEAPADGIVQPLGVCPVCGRAPTVNIDPTANLATRHTLIRAARRTHVLGHTAGELALVPLRSRLLQLTPRRRDLLADWVYRELREEWGDLDRRGAHTIAETLDSPALHRLWHDAVTCGGVGCRHA